MLLGTPWVLAALPQIVAGSRDKGKRDFSVQLYEVTLVAGLGFATLVTLAIVWARWVMVPSESIDEDQEKSRSWTHRIGLTLAIAWPLQYALAMVVIGTPT
ncbi:hypothetical protein [Tautonia rosea]|uniref:hypothetical protein n=1 Tax=Tautonia rosea TaxID=2728037 RepID=UPI0014745A4E|nr:hypothetical protein [Tautonia rosea]